MNSGVPNTLQVFSSDIARAKPRSPILISFVFVFINILSHLISLCMIGYGLLNFKNELI